MKNTSSTQRGVKLIEFSLDQVEEDQDQDLEQDLFIVDCKFRFL